MGLDDALDKARADRARRDEAADFRRAEMWSTVARFVEVCRERGIEPIRAQFELDSSPLGWAIYHGEGQGSFVTTDGDLLYTVSGSGKFHVRPYSDPWPSPQMLEEAMTRYLLQQEA